MNNIDYSKPANERLAALLTKRSAEASERILAAKKPEPEEKDLMGEYLKKHPTTTPEQEAQETVSESRRLPEERFIKAAQRLIDKHPPYYGQTPAALLKSSRVKPQGKMLYSLLHSHAAVKNLSRNCVAKVSEETLAEEMNLDERNIRGWLHHLEEEGWITIIRHGNRNISWYRLWPVSRQTFDTLKAMARVQHRLKTDYALSKRLSESLYPDRLKSAGQSPVEPVKSQSNDDGQQKS